MNIILAGMPGSGKSSVGEALARALGYGFADTDKIITERYGEITKIFAEHGEEYFRQLEMEAVEEVCRLSNTVVATGGGCLLNEKNLKCLKSCGRIIYLKTSLKELLKRLEGDFTRPLLKGDAEGNLKRIYGARKEIYERAADITVITDGKTPDETVKEILEKVK